MATAYMPKSPFTKTPETAEHDFTKEGMKSENNHGFERKGEVRTLWVNGSSWFEYEVECPCGAIATMRIQMAVPASKPAWQERAMAGKSF